MRAVPLIDVSGVTEGVGVLDSVVEDVDELDELEELEEVGSST
jgi:hypothetical protein